MALPGVDVLMGKPFKIEEFRCEIAQLLTEAAIFANRANKEAWPDNRCAEPDLVDAVGSRNQHEAAAA